MEIVCVIIDQFRIKFIEKPFFNYIERKFPSINNFLEEKR